MPTPQFVIITTAYNNKAWLERMLHSVLNQKSSNWRLIYIDDASNDGSVELARKRLETEGTRVRLVTNHSRIGLLANLNRAVSTCADDEVIVSVDGDDWLIGEHVIETLTEIYKDPDVWLTYGSYQNDSDGSRGMYSRELPRVIVEKNLFRKYPWASSHLKTFKTWLFRRINPEDLRIDGEYFRVTTDHAMMYPMLEMSGLHSRYIEKILYVYNDKNPLNSSVCEPRTALFNRTTILRRPPYEAL